MEIVGSIIPSSTLETVDRDTPAWRATCLRDSPDLERKSLKIGPICTGVAYMHPYSPTPRPTPWCRSTTSCSRMAQKKCRFSRTDRNVKDGPHLGLARRRTQGTGLRQNLGQIPEFPIELISVGPIINQIFDMSNSVINVHDSKSKFVKKLVISLF